MGIVAPVSLVAAGEGSAGPMIGELAVSISVNSNIDERLLPNSSLH